MKSVTRRRNHPVRALTRWAIGVVVLIHGAIHLMGVVKAFGWAEVSQLSESISTPMGFEWLGAAAVVATAGVLLIARVRSWWIVGGLGAVVSQIVILTSWTDAKAGTIANVVLAAAAAQAWFARGRRSYRADYGRLAARSLVDLGPTAGFAEVEGGEVPLVTAREFDRLPPRVAAMWPDPERSGSRTFRGSGPRFMAGFAVAPTNPGCPSTVSRSTRTGISRRGCSSWTRRCSACRLTCSTRMSTRTRGCASGLPR